MTNRELSEVLQALMEDREGQGRILRDYLATLLACLEADASRSRLPSGALIKALYDSYVLPVPPVTRSPRRAAGATQTWDAVSGVIAQQIADLEDLRRRGAYENPWRMHGTDTTTGRRWYNFETAPYLTAAIEGAIWRPGQPERPLSALSWEELGAFIEAGRAHQ